MENRPAEGKTLISVIVPVYQVEPYLRQCLDSIAGQTMREIEILLIDDGSTDGGAEICDEYREKDPRFAVVHTENRGLSAARNLGIGKARGEWLMFADGDDWVEEGFCEVPYRAARENDADLVIFGFRIYRETMVEQDIRITGTVPAETAVQYGRPAVWNKLYHRHLFDEIRYPEGRVYEDLATTHRIVYNARRIIMLDDPLYNYRIRGGSISRRKDAGSYRLFYRTCRERNDELQALGYPKELLERELLDHSLRYLIHMEPSDEDLFILAAETVSGWKGDLGGLSARNRNALKLWRINPKLFHSYYREKKCRDSGQTESP